MRHTRSVSGHVLSELLIAILLLGIILATVFRLMGFFNQWYFALNKRITTRVEEAQVYHLIPSRSISGYELNAKGRQLILSYNAASADTFAVSDQKLWRNGRMLPLEKVKPQFFRISPMQKGLKVTLISINDSTEWYMDHANLD
jgi:hypothetical protein